MSDLTQSTVATPDGAKNTSATSALIPFFNADDDDGPSVFSCKDMNKIVSLLRALQALTVKVEDAEPNPDGSFTNTAKFTLSDTNSLLELFFAPGDAPGDGGGATLTPMIVQSYTTTNDYLSAKNVAFASGAWTASGSAVNVALPWELRPAQNPGGQTLSPVYAANDIIFVVTTSAGQNGVVVGSELTLMDLGLGRTWIGTIVNYRGTYNTATAYNPGDVVRQQSGASQGVWIRVGTGATTGTDPVFPEPSTTGGTNVWEMWTFGIQSDTSCASGTGVTQYFNASPV